jgi:hypothetical protein
LDAILASEEVRCHVAQHGTHRHAPVVGFLVVHVFGVLAKADWITKVACILLRILLPNGRLHDAREDEERPEAEQMSWQRDQLAHHRSLGI